jgi:environmental stress-induced protein Ves
VTREIAREPMSGEEFAWRLSLAAIDRDCDFSAFPGYRRALVLVAGDSLRLRFRGHGACSLDPARRHIRFEGEWKADCRTPQGRCTDLSLIVRKDSAARSACILRVPMLLPVISRRLVVVSEALYAAFFVIEGSVAVAESGRSRSRPLRAWDTLLVAPGARRALTFSRIGRHPARLVFLRWRPGPDLRPSPISSRGA